MKRSFDMTGGIFLPEAKKTPAAPNGPFGIRFCVPEVLGSGLIGTGGCIATEIKARSQAKFLGVSSKGMYFPGTSDRVVTITGLASDHIVQAMILALEKVDDLIMKAQQGQGTSFGLTGNKPGEIRIRPLMPSVIARQVFGPAGEDLTKLAVRSGASVVLEPFGEGGLERVVTLTGTPKNVRTAAAEITRVIQQCYAEPWFPEWLSGSSCQFANVPQAAVPSLGSGTQAMGGGMQSLQAMQASSQGDAMGPLGGAMGSAMSSSAGGAMGGQIGGTMGGAMGVGQMGGLQQLQAPIPISSSQMGNVSGMAMGGLNGGAPAMQPTNDPGVELLTSTLMTTPSSCLRDPRGFAINCTIPDQMVAGLIGKGGENVQKVSLRTNTKILIREIDGDPAHKSLNITGPLVNTCSAFMLMMSSYIEVEPQLMPVSAQPGSAQPKGFSQ